MIWEGVDTCCTGRIDAQLVVDIRSQITRDLTKGAFRDGQFVAKGAPLAGLPY